MSIKSVIKGEPVAVVGSIVTAYHTIVAAVLAFGLANWTAEQVVTAEAAFVALLAIPVTLFVRNSVTPNANIPELVNSTPWLLGYPDELGVRPYQVTYADTTYSDTTLPVATNREA